MILIYRILTNIIYPLLFILIYLRKIFNKEDAHRYKEKILTSNFNVKRKVDSKLILFHAASLGELKSIVPIIEILNKKNKNLEILITTVTLSSSNLAKVELKKFKNVYHRFMPLDINFLIKKFLNSWKPNAIFLVDSEIWPNFIYNASKNKIPLAIINARITSKSFNRWMMFSDIAKKIFSLFDLCLTSNLQTKKYLKILNAKNIYFDGNIKLASKLQKERIKNPNKKFLLKNKFWFAASTHKEEDDFCIKTHLALKENDKNIISIIAPRHISRVKSMESLCKKNNLNVQILNKDDLILKNKEIILINSFGLLESYFKFSKSVFIGKSMIKKLELVGGQDPINAAKLGCKIYHGPYVYNFREIYEILEKNNISKKIFDFRELKNNLIKDLKKPGKNYNQINKIINQLGDKTLKNTMKNINKFLKYEI